MRKKLFAEEFVIAFRKKNDKDDFSFINKTNLNSFVFCNNTFLYWFADPFIFKYKNDNYIFAERFNKLTGKGHIVCKTLKEKSKWTKLDISKDRKSVV